MSKALPSVTATSTERTFRVERETPRSGGYVLRIHREVVLTHPDGRTFVEQEVDAFREEASKVAQRTAARTYLGRCQAAKVPADLIQAEAAFYDDLVDEFRAERAQAVIDAAAAEAARLAAAVDE